MKYFDYENGTAYIVLYKGDFVSESRFKAYADFMNQKGDIIRVPIDSERARNIRIPKTDTQPVVHGKWVDESHEETKGLLWFKRIFQYRIVRCDQCGNFLDLDGVNAGRGDANFCPNCGADMREET